MQVLECFLSFLAVFGKKTLSSEKGNMNMRIIKNSENDNCLNGEQLSIKKDSLALAVLGEKQKAATGFEPVNNGFATPARHKFIFLTVKILGHSSNDRVAQ